MNCNLLRDHYELYALGLAEEPETSEIRAHLERRCPACLSGVRGARELAALLGASAPPAQPPARLRRRVLALAGGGTSPRWLWAPAWAALAAAVTAVLAGVFFNAHEQQDLRVFARIEADSARDQKRELARLNAAFAILNEPEARQVVFGAGRPQPPRGRVFLDPHRGVLLLASHLPPAPAGKLYEMWVIPKGGKPVPAGMFQSADDGTAMNVLPGSVDVASTGAVAVTLEVEAGVPQPTSTPVIVAAL